MRLTGSQRSGRFANDNTFIVALRNWLTLCERRNLRCVVTLRNYEKRRKAALTVCDQQSHPTIAFPLLLTPRWPAEQSSMSEDCVFYNPRKGSCPMYIQADASTGLIKPTKDLIEVRFVSLFKSED